MSPNDADGMANSADPDQTAPRRSSLIWVCTVFPGMSVRKVKNITVMVFFFQGKIRGKTGYFPATYVIPLQADQRVFQVLQPLNLLDGNNSIKFHKDQVS